MPARKHAMQTQTVKPDLAILWRLHQGFPFFTSQPYTCIRANSLYIACTACTHDIWINISDTQRKRTRPLLTRSATRAGLRSGPFLQPCGTFLLCKSPVTNLHTHRALWRPPGPLMTAACLVARCGSRRCRSRTHHACTVSFAATIHIASTVSAAVSLEKCKGRI